MATPYDRIEPPIRRFIEAQPVFFTGTAARDGRVNVSPKGMDSLRIMGPNRILWRNLTGSGNETAAHLDNSPRMTLMWCAFEGAPMIVRAYGTARSIHRNDRDWNQMDAQFTPDPAARQLFELDIDLVQKSCGWAVPEMTLVGPRDTLANWAEAKGEQGLRDAWARDNATTIDGTPTYIVERNLAD